METDLDSERARLFVGRERELASLEALLAPRHRALWQRQGKSPA